MNTQTFKKGDKVTRIASWDQFGTVYVTHYIVSSWGKKQATLVKVDDLTNAKFRVYTADASRIQGTHSSMIVATADYIEAVALQFAVDCIADENRRAIGRKEWNEQRGTYDAHEQRIFAEHNAVAWTPRVKS